MVSLHPRGVKPLDRPAGWVALALGSNLGDQEAALAFARRRLAEEGFRWTRASRVVESAPCGGPPGQGPYLNQVLAALLERAPGPWPLLRLCQRIEREAGRRRTIRWGPRTLDIDILIHGDAVRTEERLVLPHPRLPERRFVLEPLAEILPVLPLPPEGRTAVELLARLGDRGLLRPHPCP